MFQKILVWKKSRNKKVGVWFYRRNFFVSRRRKASWANPSVFQKFSSTEKSYGEERGVSRFPSKIFVPNRRKTSRANTSVFQNILLSNFFG